MPASSYSRNHTGYKELTVRHPDADMKIRLIEPDLLHAPHSLEWLSQREVGQHMGADFSDLSLEGERKRLKEIIESTDEYNWMIELNGKVIGNVCINSIEDQSKKHGCRAGSMAILIGDLSAWGKRIARHVNEAVIDWAFNDGKFDELHARIMEENIASTKSFMSLGFELTGAETEKIKGTLIHWNHYKMTKNEWHLSSGL
jgi:RimJ/RimL family protein N-acetyltransferase